MGRESTLSILKKYKSILQDSHVLPKNIEISPFGGQHMCSVFNKVNSKIITNSVYNGIHSDPATSMIIALTEYVERLAIKYSISHNIFSIGNDDSSGFAAFPVFSKDEKLACEISRKNALAESIERYVWAKWWDDEKYGAKITVLKNEPSELKRFLKDFTDTIKQFVDVDTYYIIKPLFKGDHNLVVIFAKLKSGGFISAGAATEISKPYKAFYGAFSELIRHAIATHHMNEESITPVTFYEKRLKYFSSGKGNAQVLKRLNRVDMVHITLPSLVIDEQVEHPLKKHVKVHRTFFKDQPVFLGGEIDRLCI